MENNIIETGNTSEKRIYAGFFIRILSGLIDWIINILFISINFFIMLIIKKNQNLMSYFIILEIITILFQYIYYILIPQKFGGTFGKLILGIKIIKLNNQNIGFKESFLRYSINILWYIYDAIIKIYIIANSSNELFNSFGSYTEWSNYLENSKPKISIIALIFINLWIFSEYIVLLFNKKRRGLNDYIAGTVIINKKYLHKIKEQAQTAYNKQ